MVGYTSPPGYDKLGIFEDLRGNSVVLLKNTSEDLEIGDQLRKWRCFTVNKNICRSSFADGVEKIFQWKNKKSGFKERV